VSEPGRRVVLAERAPGPDYAVRFEEGAFVVEGVGRLGGRRVPTRAVFGLERAGAWLWIGAGVIPAVIGGDDVPAERLARVEAELRAALRALPDGQRRLARLDARRTVRLHRPWLTAALGVAAAAALVFAPQPGPALTFVTNALLLVAVGLLVEPWLGAVRAFVSGAAGWLAAASASGRPWLALVPLGVTLGWIGFLAVVRVWRETALSVRLRCALDASALFAFAAVAHALATGAPPLAVAAAVLAGALVAPIVLRRWPEGGEPGLD
jgi:hypothetical protein